MKFLLLLQFIFLAATPFTHSCTAFQVGGLPSSSLRQQRSVIKTKQQGLSVRGGTRLFNGITEAWDAYNKALEANPLFVKSVTAAVILGSADFAGQALEKMRSDDKDNDSSETTVDFARAARFAIFGLVLQAPWNHFYYTLLDGQIPPTDEPFSGTNILKVGIDQFVQAPIFTVLIFAFLGALEGKGLEAIKKQLQEDYPDTIVANCTS